MENKHRHKWHTTTKPNILMCECDTVVELQTLLHNIEADAALQSRVNTVSRLLFDRELKKQAHDREYRWVMEQNNKKGVRLDPLRPGQEKLL